MLFEELSLTHEILATVESNANALNPNPETNVALKGFIRPMQTLSSILQPLLDGLSSSSSMTRKWTAMEAVKQSNKISRLQVKLHEARSNLAIAQVSSGRYVSQSTVRRIPNNIYRRMEDHRYQTQQNQLQQILTGMAQPGLVRELSFHSNKIITRGGGAKEIINAVSSAKGYCSLDISVRVLVEPEINKAIEKTVACVPEKQHTTTPSTVFHHNTYHHLIEHTRKVYRPGLGTVRCSIKKYQVIQAHGKEFNDTPELFETQTCFSFVPSRWLIKAGISSMVQFGITRLNFQGLNTRLQTYNVSFVLKP